MDPKVILWQHNHFVDKFCCYTYSFVHSKNKSFMTFLVICMTISFRRYIQCKVISIVLSNALSLVNKDVTSDDVIWEPV